MVDLRAQEPSYLAAAISLRARCRWRAPRLRAGVLWFLGVIAGAIALGLRRGGGMVAFAGISAGYLFGYCCRSYSAAATLAVHPLVIRRTVLGAAGSATRVVSRAHSGRVYHTGHVHRPATPTIH